MNVILVCICIKLCKHAEKILESCVGTSTKKYLLNFPKFYYYSKLIFYEKWSYVKIFKEKLNYTLKSLPKMELNTRI